jgi:N-acyl-D-aspartate/D-glutamate deacylase
MFDLKIINGTIVDGTGSPSYVGDIAIKDGLIAEIGSALSGDARETIDATGLIVSPGFVDIHTHYDGQATWDPVLDPSASHGVTTVVVGAPMTEAVTSAEAVAFALMAAATPWAHLVASGTVRSKSSSRRWWVKVARTAANANALPVKVPPTPDTSTSWSLISAVTRSATSALMP